MKTLTFRLELTDDVDFYLESAARIRGVSRTQLVRKTMTIILKDQMFLSILDDGDRPSNKTAHGNKIKRGRPRDMPPKDHTFDALKPVRAVVKRKPNAQTVICRGKRKLTRSEMEAELHQAVLNTGGEPIT